MNGKGVFIWPDGKKFNGEFLEDKKHGKGEFELPGEYLFIYLKKEKN